MQYLIHQMRIQYHIIEKLSAVFHPKFYHELFILTKFEPLFCRHPWADPEPVCPPSPSDLSLNTKHYQPTFNPFKMRQSRQNSSACLVC